MPFVSPARWLRRTGLGWPAITAAAVICIVCGCNQPRFDYEYGFGLKVAQSRKIPLMLYFADFTTTLHRELINKVFPNAAVRAEMSLCENVALTWQWGPAPKRYGISTPHVFAMCGGDGVEVDRLTLTEPPTPAAFADWLRNARQAAAGATTNAPASATSPAK